MRGRLAFAVPFVAAVAMAFGWGCGGGAGVTLGDAPPGDGNAPADSTTLADGDTPTDATVAEVVVTDVQVIDVTDASETADTASDADAGAGDDAPQDAPASDDVTEASFDAPPDGACSEAGQPCTYAGMRALCNASLTCAPCNDPSVDANDDPACTSAYGGAQICLGGVCTPGNCRVPVDCVVGYGLSYCGHNVCGSCIYDTQCSGPSPFCDYLLPEGGLGGHCVARAGLTACGDAGDNSPCPANPGDVCCGGVCRPGTCCPADGGTAFCQATQGASLSCVSGLCTTCPPPSGTDFYVDPVNGDDTIGTGSLAPGDGGGSASCAFKSITRALTVIPLSPAPGTRIIVLGPSTVGAAETFPLRLRSNIVLTTQGGAVALNVFRTSYQTTGVQLLGPGSGVQGGAGAPLTISGSAAFDYLTYPDWGVIAPVGTDDTTFLESVTVQNFITAGIEVPARGVLTIRQGVVSTGAQQAGLMVAGRATIAVAAGQVPTSFSSNAIEDPFTGGIARVAGDGIEVTGGGSIVLRGVPGAAPGTGTILTNANAEAGLSIYPATSTQAPSPPSIVDGLVSYGNGPPGTFYARGASGGVVIYGGSNVRLRNSVVLGNLYMGVSIVSSQPTVADAGPNDDISHVDLGTTALLDGGGIDWGHNVLQALADAGQNQLAGLCLGLDPGSGVLAAAGNVFSGRDCSGAAPGTITASRGSCTGGVDVGFPTAIPDAGAYESGTGYAGNDIDVSNCLK